MSVILLLRQSTKIVKHHRCISLFLETCRQNEKPRDNFTPVYKFPYIMPLSLINRLKIYQTVLTVTGIPLAAILTQLNYLPNGSAYFTAVLGITGCLTLYSLGYLTHKFVGFIYYNKEKDLVKISYIDFWGKRKDIELPAKDLVPLNELAATPMDGLFLTLRRFSTQETLKLNLKFGIILDKEKIKNIL